MLVCAALAAAPNRAGAEHSDSEQRAAIEHKYQDSRKAFPEVRELSVREYLDSPRKP